MLAFYIVQTFAHYTEFDFYGFHPYTSFGENNLKMNKVEATLKIKYS